MSNSYLVAIYLTDKAYGGPEEGGWWYECGEHIKTVKVFPHENRAWGYAHRMQRLLDKTLNKERRPISSVLSEGWYSAEVHENHAPHHYPAITPHYE